MLHIRYEQPADISSIRLVNESAFPTKLEADLVDSLRSRGGLLVSLVAEQDQKLSGHIAFSRVTVKNHPNLFGAGLGPMAVLPEMQRNGIGSRLVREGIEACRALQVAYLVVLGHPEYYPRFGFFPASRFGLRCFWEVPDEVFMAMELQPGALKNSEGLIQYEREFYEME